MLVLIIKILLVMQNFHH